MSESISRRRDSGLYVVVGFSGSAEDGHLVILDGGAPAVVEWDLIGPLGLKGQG